MAKNKNKLRKKISNLFNRGNNFTTYSGQETYVPPPANFTQSDGQSVYVPPPANFTTPQGQQTYVAPPTINNSSGGGGGGSYNSPAPTTYSGNTGFGNVSTGGFYGAGASTASQGGLSSFYGQQADPNLMNQDYQQQQLDNFYSQEYDDLGSFYDMENRYRSSLYQNQISDNSAALDRYIAGQEANFAEDRIRLDQNEAKSGTLFSSGRVNRRTDLGAKYQRNFDDAYARAASGLRDIGLDAEYQLGSNTAGDFNYNLTGASFDANAIKPTVNSSLQSEYSANNGYDGRLGDKRASAATRRAIERLVVMNQGQLPTYYNNN